MSFLTIHDAPDGATPRGGPPPLTSCRSSMTVNTADIRAHGPLLAVWNFPLLFVSNTAEDAERWRGSSAWLGRGFVLIRQGASQLNGIGTLLQPHDRPVLQGPHVRETCGEPLAAPSGTPRIAAEGDDAFA
jgi:hypothetical protein